MLLSQACLAQQIRSPEVNANSTVTLRLRAPEAKSVVAKINRVPSGTLTLTKTAEGVWEGTSQPLPAGIHEYAFEVDGTRQIDPRNRWVKKWYSLESLFEIPGSLALLTELQSVPHGTLHHHYYHSSVTDTDRPIVVYTPPGYDPIQDQRYPVLFLLHGFGDDQTAWTEVGRAHRIADNLIASGELEPLIIVMPYGHPVDLPYGHRADDYGPKNDEAMEREIVDQLVPLVESWYRIDSVPDRRAIVGLSMGGGHSLKTGLKHTDTFAWVGGFSSSAPQPDDLLEQFPALVPDQTDAGCEANRNLKLLWFACGKDDFLLQQNRDFATGLKELNVRHQYVETDGAHNWSVWREYLPTFLKKIFR